MPLVGPTAEVSGVAQPLRKDRATIRVSPTLVDAGHKEADEVVRTLQSSPAGLTQIEAEERLGKFGFNEVSREAEHGWPWRLLRTTRNPLVILLTALAALSFATGDVRAGVVMLLMVILGVGLRFVQESRADTAAAKLRAMIHVTATVLRDGQTREISLKEIVPGDVIKLAAGDMIPADVRLLSSKDLFVVQASLTGESLPVEKSEARVAGQSISPLELTNVCFLLHFPKTWKLISHE